MADTAEQSVLKPLVEFYDESKALLEACDKPNRDQFRQTAFITLTGFAVLGFIGFVVKLVHIPITGVLTG